MQAARDPNAAHAAVEAAERALAKRDLCQPCSMGFHVAAAIYSAHTRDLERARRHLDDGERIAGMWQGGPWSASVWEARGALRLAEGNTAQATALFREAADMFAHLARPLDEARCRAAAATT